MSVTFTLAICNCHYLILAICNYLTLTLAICNCNTPPVQTGDRCAVSVRGRGQGHQQGAHSQVSTAAQLLLHHTYYCTALSPLYYTDAFRLLCYICTTLRLLPYAVTFSLHFTKLHFTALHYILRAVAESFHQSKDAGFKVIN